MPTVAQQPLTAADKIGQVAFGYFASSALNAIVRLDLADLLGEATLSIDELAKRTSTNRDALCRVLRLLCSIGIFVEVGDEKFVNNDASMLLRKGVEGSQREMILFITDPFHFKAYTDMLPTIRDGQTAAQHIWGKGLFDVFAEDKEEQQLFDDAMTNFSQRAIPAVLEAYDFKGIGKLVDVAGGHGALLTAILQKHPQMSGVLFDLPHVTPGGIQCIGELKLSDRCEVVAGDFFKSVPAGDAIIMKHIIHDWDDQKSIAILKTCHQALSKTGPRKVLLVEMLLAGRNEAHPSKFLDIEMLMLPGGKERTEQQFAALFQQAGFKLNRVVPTRGPWVVIEAVAVD